MSKTAATTRTQHVQDVKKAEKLIDELSSLLKSFSKVDDLSDKTKHALANAGWDIDHIPLDKVFERALDELDAVPASRVDTDLLDLSHGTTLCFGLWVDAKAEGEGPYRGGRSTGDDFDLIERFMKSHKGIEVSTHHVPFGGSGETFEITGKKSAREKFENDPRFERLQQALDDIFWTDHSAGYSDDIATRKRKIKAPMKFVFGKS